MNRSIFFTGILRKAGRPQEQSFLPMLELPTWNRRNRKHNCRFHQLHYYYGFQAIELLKPSVLVKHPACHLFSDTSAGQVCPQHIPVFLFSDKGRSLFCRSSKHSPPIMFSLSVRPWHHGISPCVRR